MEKVALLVERKGWTSTSDMSIQDYEAILKIIYNLPMLDQEIRGMSPLQ